MATFEDFMRELMKAANSQNSTKKQNTTQKKKKKNEEEETDIIDYIYRAFDHDDDIAPTIGGGGRSFADDVKEKEKDIDKKDVEHGGSSVGIPEKEETPRVVREKKRTWFDSGAFSNGYDFGDITKTILGTADDVVTNVQAGALGIGEKVVDLGASLLGGGAKLFGQDDFAKDMQSFVKKDLYDEEALAKKIPIGGLNAITRPILGIMGEDDSEDVSVFGEKLDSAAQSGGQLLAQYALQAVGIPWWVTSGVSSAGGELENAFNNDASYGEAFTSAAVTAGAEILTEKISGGIKFGGKTLDDALTKQLARNISNKTVRTLAKLGLDMGGEGAEEIVSGVASALGQHLTYADDKELGELFSSEDAWESFIGGALLGGVGGTTQAIKAKVSGVDYASGLNEDEETVLNKLFEGRVKEEESGGKKVTEKQKSKIYDEIMENLEKGYVSVDDIERILGGDSYAEFERGVKGFNENATYKAYKDAATESQKLTDEFEALKKVKRDDSTLGDEIRVGEIQNRLGELKTNSGDLLKKLQPEIDRINGIKDKLRSEVFTRVKDGKLAESYRELARSTQKFVADPSKYKSEAAKKTIQNLVDGGIANNTNEFREFAELMAKISDDKGAVFDITDNKRLKGTRFAVKGATTNAFVTEDGNITINKDSKKRLNALVGHEITHVLEGTEFYTELQEAVKKYAQTKGEWDSRLKSVTDLYKKYKPDADPTKELTADLIGEYIFNDRDFVMNLSTSKNAFRKVFDEIKYLAKIATAGSKEARQLEKAKKVFEEVWKSTTKKPTKTEHSISEDLTAEQQEYFKDSVVRDESGNLKVMYHGTSKGGFTVFDTYRSKYGLFGTGFYFTDSKNIGDSYTKKGKGSSPQVYEAYLNIKNPLDMDAQANPEEWQNAFEDVDFPESGTNEQFYRAMEEYYEDQQIAKWEVEDIIRESIEYGMGYDGITHIGGGRVNADGERHRVYIAFNPEQIKNIDNQNPTSDADIRYSISEETDTRFTPTEIQTIQNIGRKSINNFTSQDIAATEKFAQRYWEEMGTKSPFYRAWFGDWRANDTTPIQVATQIGDTRGVQKNADTGWDIQVSGKVFSETRHHTDSYNIAARKYLPYINDIVRNAVLLDSHAIDPNKPKSQNTLLVHSMYAVADIGKGPEVLKLYVEEINNPNNTSTTKRSYQLQNIEKYRPTGKSSQNTASSISPVAGSVTTVADLFNYVKGLDKNFTPDASSKIVNADGTPKVMYHGSPAQFTIFDRSKAKSGGHYGKGFYFSDSTSHAGTYGNLYSVYLNIRNPLQSGGEAVSRSQVRKYLEAVAENEDYSIENYGTYDVDAVLDIVMGQAKTGDAFQIIQDISATAIGDMVEAAELFNSVNGTEFDGIVAPTETVAFYPEQIKSATDNIGTFDKSNPDIRFSLSEAVEETKDLMALHNLHTNELLKQLDMGGMVYPSIAVTDPSKIAHEDFGDITAILHRDAIDPKTSKYNHIYSSDAYTPTFPHVSYEANREVADKVIARVRAQFDSLPDYYQRSLRSLRDYDNLNNVLNNRGGFDRLVESYVDDHGMKQLYLAEKGEAVPMVINRTETELTDYQKALYQTVVDRLGKEKILALNDRGYYNTLGEARIAWTKEHLDVLKDIYAEDWSADGTMTKAEALEIANEQKLFYWYKEAAGALEYLENGGLTVVEKEDLDATNAKVDEKIAGSDYKQWLNELFSGIEGLSGIRNNKDTFLPSGKRRSFAQLHDPVTIDNVIKVMRKKDQTGQGAVGGNFGGAAVQEYKSIAEAKRNADMLGVIDETEYKGIKQSIDDRLFDIARRYANGKDIIDAKNAIVEAIAKNESKNGIERYLKQYDYVFEYKDGIAEEIIKLRDYVRSLPRPYFEAKPRRAVGFDEVAVFVIPRNADVKLKQELLNRGYNIAEYDPDVEGDRQKVVNQFEEYKFSLSDAGDAQRSGTGYGVHGDKIGIRSTTGFDPFADIGPIGQNVMPVAQNVQPIMENPFPDTLDTAQAELDNLLQQREALESRMLEAVNTEDFDAFNQINTEYESVMARIGELEGEIAESESGRIGSLSDADAPPVMDAPYDESPTMRTPNPFYERDMKEVGNRKVKAYMYENPEVKPFFQEAALGMLGDLHESVRGEKWYNDDVYYESGGEKGWGGTKRQTTEDIADLLDNWGYTYADIEKGLNAIIEDDGAENNACSKRIEFMLHDRLVNGHKSVWGEPFPPNQEYIDLLKEKQVNEYSEEAFNSFMESADQYAPPVEAFGPVANTQTAYALSPADDVGPVATQYTERKFSPPVGSLPATEGNAFDAPIREEYEAIRPQSKRQPKMVRIDAPVAEQTTANVMTEEPQTTRKKTSLWKKFVTAFGDKGNVFETLSLKTKNRELQAKYNSLHYAEGNAQNFIGEGADGVRALADIQKQVESSGKTEPFYWYMYHLHNSDRMSLAKRGFGENKAVFGDRITAEQSLQSAAKLEAENPEFRQLALDIYNVNSHLRQMMVNNGIISQETANLWAQMYPHYVPIRRLGDDGLNINVPLDTNKTGVNAPVKRATGGNRDILPLFDTMAQRVLQTYKAVAKNRFGVELKNTLGTVVEKTAGSVDEVIDSIDKHEELLQEGKNGNYPTFTVFENGEKVTFEITEEMFDAMKPTSDLLATTIKPLNTISNIRRGLITEYNPVFLATNAIKDAQDILINSQHAAKTYLNLPLAAWETITEGDFYKEYMAHGGAQNTYFEKDSNTFAKEKSTLRKVVGFPLDLIASANNFIERLPRLAEYMASRKDHRSIDVSMLDAARVTTNFAAGGDVTKLLNRNGSTFLNASVQGLMQNVRNVREAKENGLKGVMTLAAKTLVAGLPAMLLNHLLWDDDEEYEELSDYVKQNYYIVGKFGDGQFVRIPKGRAVSVIQNAFEQMGHLATGDGEADLKTFGELVLNNLAPNNPMDNNIFSPILQAASNTTWYGEDLVPQRLQDLPAAEQYDESTDVVSKWLGEKLNVSPVKINYLLDQYSGGLGDTFLPMLTPEAERGDNSLIGNLVAPWSDKFSTDSVMNNQNISDFYDTKDELTINANAGTATDKDILMSKYMSSVNAEMSELYARKRRIQNNWAMSDSLKYEQVREIQEEINALAREGLHSYTDVKIDGEYATVGDRYFQMNDDGEWQKMSDEQVTKFKVTSHAGDAPYATDGKNHYRWYEPGEDSAAEPGWRKITDKELKRQKEVTRALNITPEKYWGDKEEYDYAYDHPETYALAKAVGGYDAYMGYKDILNDLKADKDEYGESIDGSRKSKYAEYIYGLDIPEIEKHILFKSYYNSFDDYNYEIIDYLNERDDISYKEMNDILKKLGFTVHPDGRTITWD